MLYSRDGVNNLKRATQLLQDRNQKVTVVIKDEADKENSKSEVQSWLCVVVDENIGEIDTEREREREKIEMNTKDIGR